MSQSRQLAAIMFTDIVGYTALMGRDSNKALELVRISKEIQKPLVAKHHGQWLKEMGDGALVKFGTALDAVNCAIDIQKTARAELDGKLRIGIHLGDITIENDDVYGDGVNVASRLESISDPGGIYISESIEKAIRGQAKVESKFVGEKNLKNVDYDVRVYALQGIGLPEPDSVGKRKKTIRTYTKWAVTITTILLSGILVITFINTSKDYEHDVPATAIHLQILLPVDVYLPVETKYPVFALSPDGSTIVFVGVKDGKRQLYLKRLEDPSIKLLPGTEDSAHPFFSTKGDWIGFIRKTTVLKVPVTGGVPVAIHEITPPAVNRGITWYGEDSLIHAASHNSGLMIGAAIGEVKQPVTQWRSLTEEPHYWPSEISEINSVLFTNFKSSRSEDQEIALYSLEHKTAITLIKGGSFAKYSRHHIIFSRDDALLSVPFVTKTKSIGNEQLLAKSIYTNTNGSAYFAVGGNNLVYVEGLKDKGTDQLIWVDRKGNSQSLFSNGKEMDMPRISPDGSKIAVTLLDGPNMDLWILELKRNTFTRLTSHTGEDFGPVWSPDGKQLAYSSEIAEDECEGGPGIALLTMDSSEPPIRLLSTPNSWDLEFPVSWSSNGEWILFASHHGTVSSDLEVMSTITNQRKSWEQTSNSENGGVFSPDGKWIAYVSDLSGRDEVYVKPFSAGGSRIQVSVHGGIEPLWSPDGKEIFYREYDKLMVVSVENGPSLILGSPQLLFEGSYKTTGYGGWQHNYDITPDGSRFVMINQTSQTRIREINVVINWDKI